MQPQIPTKPPESAKACPGEWQPDPRFNFHDPDFDFHGSEYLAYIENAPPEVKAEALGAAVAVAEAQFAVGQYFTATPEQISEGMRRGLSFEEMKQWLGQ